ncbi:MAG: DNA polymerase III subunit gamma/tau [Bacteroidia bacterium]|nr:DNA polymerase III subunit gamma/tau [Bacteroidia bacterium]
MSAQPFIVSARKYRPDTFASVVGQAHISTTLQHALRSGQLAHAFLFCGPRGVGKTTCARILAKAVNCQNLSPEGDPCNTCESCAAFNEGRSLNIFELDAASNNGVDDIRNLIAQLRYIPQSGRRNVYIIDEVHMLSTAAFNAFLKTLEEPPAHALFILATTEKHKILPTILSRCQSFDFRRISPTDIADRLKAIAEAEHIQYEYEGLLLIAQKAEGALRDGLSIFDQIVNFSRANVSYAQVRQNLHVLDYEVFFDILEAAQAEDHPRLLLAFDGVLSDGFDGYHFLSGLLEHLRNLLVAHEPTTVKLLELSDRWQQRYLEQARATDPGWLLNAFQLVSDAEQQYRQTGNPRLLVELTLIKLAHLAQALGLAQELVLVKKKALA